MCDLRLQEMNSFIRHLIVVVCILSHGSVLGEDSASEAYWSKISCFRALTDKFGAQIPTSTDEKRLDRVKSLEALSLLLNLLQDDESSSSCELILSHAVRPLTRVPAPGKFGMDVSEWNITSILAPAASSSEVICLLDKTTSRPYLEVAVRRTDRSTKEISELRFDRIRSLVEVVNSLGIQNSRILDWFEENVKERERGETANFFLASLEHQMLAVVTPIMIDLSRSRGDWGWMESQAVRNLDWANWRQRENVSTLVFHRALPELTGGPLPPKIVEQEAIVQSKNGYWRGVPLNWRLSLTYEKAVNESKLRLQELKLIKILLPDDEEGN